MKNCWIKCNKERVSIEQENGKQESLQDSSCNEVDRQQLRYLNSLGSSAKVSPCIRLIR